MERCFFDLDRTDQTILLDALPLLSRIFWGPTPELCATLRSADFAAEPGRLGRLLGADAARALRTMVDFAAAFDSPDGLCDQLEATYVRLFVSDRGGTAAPLYQSFYDSEERLLMGPPAQAMKRRLANAGIRLEEQSAEPPDHLAVEIEYLFFLIEGAVETRDADLQEEARHFAADEMLPWVSRFTDRLAADGSCPFHMAAARLLPAILEMVAA